MLQQLVHKDKYWRAVAYTICKDKYLADDLVQDMYLRMYNKDKEVKDYYIVVTLRNLFLDHCRKPIVHNIDDLIHLEENINKFEICDNSLNIINSLSWLERELLELSYNQSLRDIEKEFNINYAFVHRTIKKARKKWQRKKV
jgi:RNA polymerase sigma factor (sigma-70 family)